MDTLYIDIETYATVDLPTVGEYRYVEDHEFEILMAGWALNDDPVQVAIGGDAIRAIPGLDDPSVLKVAHNANFERACFSHFFGCNLPYEYLPAGEWEDTMALGASWGYPQALEAMGKALEVSDKDPVGTRLIRLFSKPQPRTGRRVRPEDAPKDWELFIEYCRQDVVVLRDIHKELYARHGGWHPGEREIWLADRAVNDAGIRIDTALAEAAVEADIEMKENARREARELTGVDNPGSRNQLLEYLHENGTGSSRDLVDLKAESVSAVLEDPAVTGAPRRVLEIRQELSLTTASKYNAALIRVNSDGRLRGSFRYFGAHTGRWSGKGVQLQNLASDSPENDEVSEQLALETVLGEPRTARQLKQMVRTMFLGPFTVCDYSAIEARVLAWLAGEQWVLDAFAAGRDIYVETASRMFHVPYEEAKVLRKKGKVAVLALGYAGGVASMRNMGGEGTDAELKEIVQQWRAANPRIVRFWKQMDVAFRRGTGSVGEYIRVRRTPYGTHQLLLPSGRSINYHNVRIQEAEKFGKMQKVITFSEPKPPYHRIQTYGGRLTENVTQAVARDLLAQGLVSLLKLGMKPVAHVHDEILVEGGDVHSVAAAMGEDTTFAPEWSAGLPLKAEGYNCKRYRKE